MSNEKQWKSVPFWKRSWMIIYSFLIIILSASIIDDIRIHGIEGLFNLNIVIIVIAIGAIISSNVKIISTDQALEVILKFQSFQIPWEDIENYSILHSVVTLNLKNSKSVPFGIRYLQNRDEFIKHLESQLIISLKTTCLNCGEKIRDDLEGCPNCNWTWKL